MNSLRRTLRRASTIAVVGGSLVLGGTVIASAAPSIPATSAQIDVDFTCTAVTVGSTKELSNVVLVFADGERERFEGLDATSGTFAGTGEHLGDVITTTWVKSGANHSGDGPGLGERFDSDQECEGPQDDPILPVLDDTTAPTSPLDEGDGTEPQDDPDDTGDNADRDDRTRGDARDDEVVLGPATKLVRDDVGPSSDRTPADDPAPAVTDATPATTVVVATAETTPTPPPATAPAVGTPPANGIDTPHEVLIEDTIEIDDGVEVLGVKLTNELPAPTAPAAGEPPLADALPATGVDTLALLVAALAALAAGAAALRLGARVDAR